MATKKTKPVPRETKLPYVIHCQYDELVETKSLKPSPYQTNKHPEDQISDLAEILKYQGLRRVPIISEGSGYLVTGHGLIEAFKRNGWHLVPVSYQKFDEDQEKAHVTADNALGHRSWIDLSKLNNILPEFDGSNFDIGLLGLKDFSVEPAEKPIKKKPQHQCPKCRFKF